MFARISPHRQVSTACSADLTCRLFRVVHGLGWVELGRDFSVVGGLGWVGSTIEKILKLWNDYVNAFKARLDKIWLHQAVTFISCIGLGPNFPTSSRLGWVSQLMGWVGSGQLWNGDIDRQRRESGSTALSSKCEQCHVVSWRVKLNMDLLTSLPLGGRALRWAYLFVCQSVRKHFSVTECPMFTKLFYVSCISSSSSFYLNQATWPIHKHTKTYIHTDRQAD